MKAFGNFTERFFYHVHTEFLIVGQGVAGTLLSRELISRGRSVHVIGSNLHQSASMYSSAVIQPLAGRTLKERPTQGEELRVASEVYQDFEGLLQMPLMDQRALLRFHLDEWEQQQYEQAHRNGSKFLNIISSEDDTAISAFTAYSFGISKIAPVFLLSTQGLLNGWQNYLKAKGAFTEMELVNEMCDVSGDFIRFGEITADNIVFCEGAQGRYNSLFPDTIMNRNKGEFLLISVPALDERYLYQSTLRLVPKGNHLWWCGSNYTWDYSDLQPDLQWQQSTLAQLKQWLNVPVTLLDHLVAERPTTSGQRPLLLRHPEYANCFFFNGLGTRGYSAGPILARRMADIITQPPNP